MTEEKLLDLDSFSTSEAFSEVERLVLRLADEMTSSPAEIPDESFRALRVHFDEEQLVELASAIAWENYRARFNRVFKAESEGFSEGAFCPMPISGPVSQGDPEGLAQEDL